MKYLKMEIEEDYVIVTVYFYKKYFIILLYMSKKQDNVFFMEIFNDILKINDTNVIIIYDTDGNIWFGLRDIIKSLGYSNIQKAMANIKTSINNKKLYSNLHPTPTGEGLHII
jgi:hypothetical protein